MEWRTATQLDYGLAKSHRMESLEMICQNDDQRIRQPIAALRGSPHLTHAEREMVRSVTADVGGFYGTGSYHEGGSRLPSR